MADLLNTLVERTAPYRAPIRDDAPSGDDVSFEPDFDLIKDEVNKLTGLAGEQPNWSKVASTAETLLQGKSKDFRAATWLTMAKAHQGGWEGFVEGLVVLRGVATEFWDTMYPPAKRARARGNMAGWLSEQAHGLFAERDVSAADGEAIRAATEVFGEIDALLDEKLGEAYPGMGMLRSMLREKEQRIPTAEAEPAPTAAPQPAEAPAPPPTPVAQPAPVAPPAPVAQAPATAPATPPAAPMQVPSLPSASKPDDVVPALRACGKSIVEAANTLRRADPAQAWPYRLQRLGTWLPVRMAPPAENGLSGIPAPLDDVKKKLGALSAGEKWLELLEAAESAAGTYLFWLDLHRLVALSMDRLGALFLPAREVVGREVTSFLERFPTIPSLSFRDGTPFADSATKAWLEEEATKYGAGGGGGGGESSAASEEDQELAKRFEQAVEMVKGGKVADGLALAVQLASRGADARTRFRARVRVAKLALQGGQPEVALPWLDALMSEAEEHALESWEPELCAEVYALLYSGLNTTMKGGKEGADHAMKKAKVFEKLCHVDPAWALRLAAG